MNRRPRTIVLLLGPGLAFLAVFFLLPLVFVLAESVDPGGRGFSLAAYTAYLSDEKFHVVFWRTIRLSLIVTPLAALFSYPAAYLISRMESGRRTLFMALVILPLMTNPVARTYAWIVILGRFGLVNQTLRALHLIAEPVRLLYSEGAVTVGLLQLFLPLMVLSLVGAMENIPEELEEAALSLGAGRLQAFILVMVRLSADGLVMGSTLVFTGCITAYVTPAILGGTRILTLATLMQQESIVLMNWVNATVIAVVMVSVTLAVYLLLKRTRPALR